MEFFFYFHFFTESVCFFYRHYAKLKKYENSNFREEEAPSEKEASIISIAGTGQFCSDRFSVNFGHSA